jgi:uncharacterized membrane protein YkoI
MKNIVKLLLVSTAALSAVGGVAVAKSAAHYSGYRLASSAHVTIAEARAIALKAHPGVVKDQELEKEAGGTGLRYSFDIKSGGKIYEIGVDAQTGAVLENAAEGPHPD